MKAILFEKPGSEDVLFWGDAPAPELLPGMIRIQVAATALNRADLLQRQGFYPPPAGASEILGLECSGVVSEIAEGVSGFRIGDRVMALLPGGGYAEEVVVDAGSVMRVPDHIDLVEAAALPEVLLTVFLNVFEIGGLREGGWLLVHGGGSGIGTASIQMARSIGAHVVVTAGSEAKCRRCVELGADVALNYREGDFAESVIESTGGVGVEVVLDSIGAPYLESNLKSLATDGRLVMIGLMGGAKSEIALGALLARRLSVVGSTLRTRSSVEKAALVAGLQTRFWTALEEGRLQPIVDRVLPIDQAGAGHRTMKASDHFGKIVLKVG
ncbi:MAG: NADPH:quinone oxidoreductase [bacterium TMED88]|nr:NADPH:quinone oxidoreductase [Deltaproteobacteria bacterium]OUV24889.1 MAG: NADPH:quinone oxidoreductase [bacterium TMED88]